MNIKDKLKIMDVKLSEFAKMLEISRPTLNAYITLYDSNKEIPNEKYKIVFDNLFDDGVDTKDKFLEVLKGFQKLIERDKVLGTLDLDIEKTDLLSSIVRHVKDDLDRDDCNNDIYIFTNMLIRSYHEEKTFVDFARYFLFLNGVIDTSEMKIDEQPFISSCYWLMDKHKKNELSVNQEYLDKFLSRVQEIKVVNEEKTQDLAESIIKDKLSKKLNKVIKDKLAMGLNVEDIDIEEMLRDIDFLEDEES